MIDEFDLPHVDRRDDERARNTAKLIAKHAGGLHVEPREYGWLVGWGRAPRSRRYVSVGFDGVIRGEADVSAGERQLGRTHIMGAAIWLRDERRKQ